MIAGTYRRVELGPRPKCTPVTSPMQPTIATIRHILGLELRSSCVRKMTQNPRMHKAKGTFRIGHGYRLLQFVATFHRRPIRVRQRLFDPKRAVVIETRNALGGCDKIRTARFGGPADNGLLRRRVVP